MDSARKRKTRLTDVHGFGLSRAQASFAIEFANGHSLRTCAERLGISPTTAKTHLQQIFAKTGASRQAELMRLILLSTPALDDEDDSSSESNGRHIDRAGRLFGPLGELARVIDLVLLAADLAALEEASHQARPQFNVFAKARRPPLR